MPTLNIEGRKVKVSDDFLKLSPQDQEATVQEIARSLGSGGGAAQQFADFASKRTQSFDAEPAQTQAHINQQKYERLPGWAKPVVAANDIMNTVVNGVTFGFGDKAAAGARSMFTGKSYEEELAGQRAKTQASRDRAGWAGTVGELAGGIRSASRLAAAGLTAMRFVPQTATGIGRLGGMMGAGAVDGAAYGGLTAIGNDTDIGTGVVTGAAIGGLAPAAFAILRNTFAPLFSRLRPEQAANSAIETMVARSGRSAQQIVDDLNAAAAEGQGGVYTVADALGNPGQRMLSTIARTPSDGRRQVVEALDARQAGQGRRVARQLEEGFGSPQTALQTEAARTQLRRAGANVNYGAARAQAGPVNTSAAIAAIDNIVAPGVTPMVGTGAAQNGVYATLNRVRSMLGRRQGGTQVSDFDRAFLAKLEMDAIIEQGGTTATLLRPARQALDDALAQSSAPYANARNTYRQQSREIEAVDIGRESARRGRFEDTIPRFQQMTPAERSGFRAGYVDPLIEGVQGAPVGVNKARPLLSDATAAEFPVFAQPGRAPILQRQLGREQRMFETRNHATGNSRTADNQADQAEMAGFDPTVLGNLLSLNFPAAGGALMRQSIANLQGLSPTVRAQLADFLLTRNSSPAMQRISAAIAQGQRVTARDIATIRLLIGSGVMAGHEAQRRGQ